MLVTDNARNAGRFVSTFFMGYNLRLENHELGNCSNIPLCPPDPTKPRCNGANGDCYGGGGERDDPVIQVEDAAVRNNMTADLPIIDNRLYYFRDSILNGSVKGKQYIRDYYKLGHLVRKDLGMLWKYADIMLGVYAAIDSLEHGTDEAIILDDTLADKILAVARDHRDITDSQLQEALDRLVADISLFRDKTRDEVLRILSGIY